MEASIRISKQFTASAVIHDRILSNKYDISYAISLVSADQHEQKIAYDRVKFLTESIFESTIFIKYNNPLLKKLKGSFNNLYSQFYEEPYDSIMVDYLFLKGQAVLEDKANIDQISLSSWQGRDIEFYADCEHNYSAYSKAPWIKAKDGIPWYMRSDIYVGDYKEDEMLDFPDWDDLYLGWKEPQEEEADIIDFRKFTGKVVKGGKRGK